MERPFRLKLDDQSLCGFVAGAVRFSFSRDLSLALLRQEALRVWPSDERGYPPEEYVEQLTVALQRAIALLREAGIVQVSGEATQPSQIFVRPAPPVPR